MESTISQIEIDANTRPVVIRDISYRGRTFRVKGSSYVELYPTYDETGELLRLEYEPMGIHVFAETRVGLLAELAEQVCMLWDEYACEDDKALTPAAIQLKNKLLGALEEA